MIERSLSCCVLCLLIASCATTGTGGPGSSAAVTSASPEATRIGIEVLRAGGNAVDAAVAVSMALGIGEPAGSGIGGQTFMLVYRPGQGALVVHGTTLAPRQLPEGVTAGDISGRRASTVPSTVTVLDVAHRRFGSGNRSWAQLVEPAARLADEGVVMGAFRGAASRRYAPDLQADPGGVAMLLAEGAVPRPRLARTLRRLAGSGASDFYRGEIAQQIALDMQRNGGWITAADLAGFPEPQVTEPLRGSYRGHDVFTLPPPTGGWVVLRALAELERATPDELATEPTRTIQLAEALRTAHRVRLQNPVGVGPGHEEQLQRNLRAGNAAGGETTHFTVVDEDGVMVAVTQSINSYFGAKVMHPELGFLYNDYMREFVTDDPAHPFALAPGAMPYSSMSATIVARDGRAVLGLGSPGSRRIVSAVVQVLHNVIDRGMDAVAATAAPRMHVRPAEGRLLLEDPSLPRATKVMLEQRGFRLSMPVTSLDYLGLSPYFGGVHAIGAAASGGWSAAADPRRDGLGMTVSRE